MRLMHEQMMRIREAKSPVEREKLMREHMQTMLEQMRAMRAMGGSGNMTCGMMSGGMMSGGMMSGGKMGGGMMQGGAAGGVTDGGGMMRCTRDRLDMMQMMMEQMMGQMKAMQDMGMGGSSKK